MESNTMALQHHGIKGMHWGIHRFQPYPKGHKGGKEIGEAARNSHDDYQRAHGIGEHKKTVNEMSDKELQARLNRLRMEQQYDQISGASVQKGKNAAGKILKTAKTVAEVTTTAITIYNNLDKIGKIVNKIPKG